MERSRLRASIRNAANRNAAFVIKNAKVVNVFTGEILSGDVAMRDGVILGVGRAIGETMAVIMVAGNQPRVPSSILEGVRTLTTNIVLEMGYAADLHREALIATAVVLFVFILLINALFAAVKRRQRI